jgi:hypothetical protein
VEQALRTGANGVLCFNLSCFADFPVYGAIFINHDALIDFTTNVVVRKQTQNKNGELSG